MWGDQWICKCGCHNFILREKCRECGGDVHEMKVAEENWVEVMESVVRENEQHSESD